MKITRTFLPAALVLMPATAMAAGTACEKLAQLALPDAKIDIAQSVPAGEFKFDVKRAGTKPQDLKNLPAFCRIAATLKPSADSDIKMEVWLPAGNWNGKFQAQGNGNWAGAISYDAMAGELRRGYATASSDTGHAAENTDGSWALNHPEKLQDFGWRSEHEMTLKAKAIVAAFYGNAAKLSYWNGCSTGGRQGLMEATRFPADYDGIIAGDSANPRAWNDAWQIWVYKSIHMDPAGAIPTSKHAMVHKAVIKACDASDGLVDGLIGNPEACHFDPKTIECKGADAPDCLTSAQAASMRVLLSPLKLANGKVVQPGYEPGTEMQWSRLAAPESTPYAAGHFKYVVYNNPNWNWKTFDADKDVPAAEKAGGMIDVMSTDIAAFVKRNGKLIMYHGWEDQNIVPMASVIWMKGAESKLGGAEQASQSARLFMVPGMEHCRGGDGPNNFDMVGALENWVEKKEAPKQVIASRIENGRTVRTRPLCPYPQMSHYKGAGSIDDAANFECKAP